MITLRRADARHHDRHHRSDSWLTFDPRNREDPYAGGFGGLEMLREERLSPGARVPARRRRAAAEIVTYVREGAITYDDSIGRRGVVQAGEFQHLAAGRVLRHSEANASRTEGAHLFQIWLRPPQAVLEPVRAQKRFSAADRRGVLCVVGSPDGRRGSLHIAQGAVIYSALLAPGQHVVHELGPGRSAWLHLVQGEVTVGGIVLLAGDGMGATTERAMSLTARDHSELLLLDLGEPPPGGSELAA